MHRPRKRIMSTTHDQPHQSARAVQRPLGSANTEAPKQGWRTVMIDGIPHWQPPDWHPNKQPQRNYLHHPELLR